MVWGEVGDIEIGFGKRLLFHLGEHAVITRLYALGNRKGGGKVAICVGLDLFGVKRLTIRRLEFEGEGHGIGGNQVGIADQAINLNAFARMDAVTVRPQRGGKARAPFTFGEIGGMLG